MPEFSLPVFLAQIAATSPLEWIAVSAGLVQVLLAWKQSIWNYAAGLLSTALTIWIFVQAGLYAESALNLYYFGISIWGIVLWSRPTQAPAKPSFASGKEWAVAGAIAGIGPPVIWAVLSHFTPSDVPLWDALVSALAWAGTWLLTQRKVENWIVLNLSNAVAIPLLYHKGLPLYAIFTLLLFILAWGGFSSWYKAAHRQATPLETV
jgi:nicotinamide mononucleotide transporter